LFQFSVFLISGMCVSIIRNQH